jgi:glucuronate isomerase
MSVGSEENVFLKTALAQRLYHECAAGQPIIDYHSHLSAADLAADRRFEDLAEVWVTHDPYKHRAMRIAGVPEALITGSDASPRARFDAWAATVPKTLGNPLYHWASLELERAFGIREPLSPQTADAIWETANAKLLTPEYSARRLLARFNVACVCTSDGLLDDLGAHRALAATAASVRVLPSLRGDDIADVSGEGYGAWLVRLEAATGHAIETYEALCAAVCQRLDTFGELGCRLADQALDGFAYLPTDEVTAARLFARRVAGETVSAHDALRLRSAVLRFLGCEYGRRGWVMQLHIGAQRGTSTRLRQLAGPAGGYAVPGQACDVASLCRFLDDVECAGRLPRTVLYTLNPADNAVLATLTGAFAEDGVAGKVQFGPAWWYNDHAQGIRQQLETLASYGLLSTFIGMTTDSRSLLSMARHEYFRRLLCGTLGEWAEQGLLPNDCAALEPLVRAVTYGNAREMVVGQNTSKEPMGVDGNR